MSKRTMARRAIRATIALGLVAVVTVACQVPVPVPGTPSRGDGLSSPNAGGSCWGIKQQFPASADGIYWLQPPGLDRPTQFYCDMTTDGGGWVLVARGRDGWTFHPGGQGSPATLRTVVDGPSAFAPAALDTATIVALTDGADLSADPDGIRLERATNATGTSRQDYRLFPTRRTWTWAFPAGQLLDHVRVNATTYNGSNTQDTTKSVPGQTVNQLSTNNSAARLYTAAQANKDYVQGFGMGTLVNGGSSSSTNYLWTRTNEGSPLAFTRIWLRPRIAAPPAGTSPIPTTGFAAEVKPAALETRAELAPWGVVGLDHTDEDTVEPWDATVLDLRVFGDRVYVGGRFTGVQQGPTGTPQPQGFLAAFDLDGNWISTFRPTLDGRVWDMVMTADGKLIVGGDFTNVDGLPGTSGMAALDPVTGSVITSWRGSVTRSGSSSRALVRALETRGDWVYAAGRFNYVDGGTATGVAVPSSISLRTSTGQPGAWRPQIGASALDLDIDDAGDRIYLAGYFNAVNGDTNHGYYAITNIADGTPVPGMGPYIPAAGSGEKIYQQAVGEAAGLPVVGGSQHDLQKYAYDRSALLDSHITKAGGDFQTIETYDGWVYGGCHCLNWTYSGTNDYSNPSGFRSVDQIRLVGRWNAQTFEYDDSFLPTGLKGVRDQGVWAISKDSRGCIWVGGDLDQAGYSGNAAADWLGGFGRFCPKDATPPTAPTNLQVARSGSNVSLTWAASTDDRGSVSYDVYRNDRVIATVSGTSYTDTAANGADGILQYTVRAADARGNRSASPAPITLQGPPKVVAEPVAYGSTWRYLDDGSDQGSAWSAPGFDDSAWAAAPAPLGWGGTEVTTIAPTRPVTTYFRRSFDVPDLSPVRSLEVQALVTQGAVVRLNGVEIGRYNLPAGRVTASTVASTYVGGTTDTTPKVYRVPASLLHTGTNTLAVEVHGWRPQSGKVAFDLKATTIADNRDVVAPPKPVVQGSAGASGVQLTWNAVSDWGGIGGYLVYRDGTLVAAVDAATTSFVDPDADPLAPKPYVVTASDANGNTTASDPTPPL